ncbi:uncharacterized protein LOC109718187 isoform X1 [Ananas comosus]|uniref:Uncharacterized protein LOC109718187 isoform X1 n=2 Tax=Ananas comosus TaxID=4615 RepID=A0A6P5G3G8_ANACO|nr:uncharacterized protein LOC109718187 isoform X1 [Ananas comosus]XP_020099836.1 uncharacterized protein LOC109718187 isoform X1 [Ananas comosus]
MIGCWFLPGWCLWNCLIGGAVFGRSRREREQEEMAMPWGLAVYIMNMVWVALDGWISSCVMVADEIAHALRTGDVSSFPIG